MVYQNKLIVAIKVAGQILREHGDRVAIPFGSEYSILIKNLHAVRAQFKLSIDGADATSGTWIVVPANSQVEMERFIANGDWSRGRRFKFIERTGDVEAHRGVKADDGIVRVEFQVERVRPVVNVPNYVPYDVPVPHPDPWYPWRPRGPFYGNASTTGGMRSRSVGSSGASASLGGVSSSSFEKSATSTPTQNVQNANYSYQPDVNEAGITVQGSESHQQFHAVAGFETTGQSEVVVLHLRGAVAGQPVQAPVTVQTKLTCSSCGLKSKSTAEFCARCGTALVA